MNICFGHCFFEKQPEIFFDPTIIHFLGYAHQKKKKKSMYITPYKIHRNAHNNTVHKSPKLEITQKSISCLMGMYILLLPSYCHVFEYIVWQIVFSKDSCKNISHPICPS